MKAIIAIFVALVSCALAIKEFNPNKTPIDPLTVHNNLNKTENPYGWVMYKQCDSRWGGQQLGSCSATICSAGCAMSSVAMILATRGVSVDPSSFNSWLDGNGGYESGCGIIWSTADKFGKTAFQGLENASYDAICTSRS
eukprot:TRINITY_DN51_c0_g1_i1.p1 TRINITY_DN51_c0_g1~~TRINITY_DN51_c0_g1_i1.p1  ORF type:complete len:155 (-),score=55.27 TRINITY_DN51_c0_g1_i1:16-435(-)